jgi:YggT family protein
VDLFRLVTLISQAIEIYSYIMLIWAICSWFPQLHGSKFFSMVDKLVYPYVSLFRNLIPPIGGFDFSIIVAFLALNLIQKLLFSLI